MSDKSTPEMKDMNMSGMEDGGMSAMTIRTWTSAQVH